VTNYVAAVGTDDLPPVVVSIGPVTTDAARQLGIDVTLQADEATVAGLVDAVRQVIGR
jgi:uroporphyrinogen-III synthase